MFALLLCLPINAQAHDPSILLDRIHATDGGHYYFEPADPALPLQDVTDWVKQNKMEDWFKPSSKVADKEPAIPREYTPTLRALIDHLEVHAENREDDPYVLIKVNGEWRPIDVEPRAVKGQPAAIEIGVREKPKGKKTSLERKRKYVPGTDMWEEDDGYHFHFPDGKTGKQREGVIPIQRWSGPDAHC